MVQEDFLKDKDESNELQNQNLPDNDKENLNDQIKKLN